MAVSPPISRHLPSISTDGLGQVFSLGKLGENSDASAGLRASCPNFYPKNSWTKVRTNFQSQTYSWQYHIFHCMRCNFYFHQLHESFGFGCSVSQVVFCFVRIFGLISDHWV